MISVLVRDTKGRGQTFSEQVGMTYPSLYDPSA